MLAFLHGTIDGKATEQLARLEAQITRPINSARALQLRSSLEKCAGRLEESLRSAEAASRCDPFSISARFSHAWSLFLCGHAEEALDIGRESTKEMPWVPYGPAFTAMFAAYLGELDLAQEEARRALDIAPENLGIIIVAAYALACAGLGDEARRLAAGTLRARFPRAPLSFAAAVYAALGDADQARALLDQARDEAEPWFPAARYDPRLAGIYPNAGQQADARSLAG
jgi:tetratricopeptide (TPR) repeat protein